MHGRRAVRRLLFQRFHRRASTTAFLAAALGLAGSLAASPCAAAAQGRVDSATFWSQSLGIRKRFLVWLPPSYDTAPQRRYPVAYYLHGLWGSEHNWTGLGSLHRSLESLTAAGMPELIVVMPDGDDGWYTTWNWLGDWDGCRRGFTPRPGDTVDSYCVPWPHYDDYIARDLVAYVDSTWRTRADRSHRAIAGLSMGGYGAIALALSYPDVFTAAASHSGLLSPLYIGGHPFSAPPRYAPDLDALSASYGERLWPLMRPMFGPDTAGWWSRDPSRKARRLAQRDRDSLPALMIDVGVDDRLAVDQTRAFHHELQALRIPHVYAEWPGDHSWAYWTLHARESLRWIAARIAP
jgi:S-formylglutathione hydrolase FrmB